MVLMECGIFTLDLYQEVVDMVVILSEAFFYGKEDYKGKIDN